MSPWLKAGLVGAVVLVVLNLLGLIPCVGLVTCILGLVAYAGIGALAAYWLPPVRMAGQGVQTIIATIQMAVTDTAAILSQIPAESLQQLEQAGVDPALFVGPTAGVMIGSFCCIGGLILAAILGAIGGAIFAAVKPD
jgi:hypothetical protein